MLNLHKLDGFVNIKKNAAYPVSIMKRFHKTLSCHIIRSCRFSFRLLLHQRGEARLSMLLRVCVPELSSDHHGLSDRTGGCGGRRETPRRCRLAAEATATATGGPLPTWRSRVTHSRTTDALFVCLISHQPTVLFSHNKSAISNQPTVFFSQNKPAPAISHQPNEQAARWRSGGLSSPRRRRCPEFGGEQWQ
jgi:hypothetical protein